MCHRKVAGASERVEDVGAGGGAAAVFFGEEDVVVLAGVDGWIEVDQVDRLVGEVAAQDFEVVAVVELVLRVGRGCRHDLG